MEAATEDIDLLQILLAALDDYPDPLSKYNIGRCALDKAVQKQDWAMIEAILGRQLVDVNSIQNERTALHDALVYDSSPNFKIIRMLLDSGANPDGIVLQRVENEVTYYSQSTLLVVISQENVQKIRILLEAGAKADSGFMQGMQYSPMQRAIKSRKLDIVRLLLGHGSNANTVSSYGAEGTPIQLAGKNKDVEMVKILLHHSNPNALAGNMLHTPLQMAASDECKEMVEVLLEGGADVNSLPAKRFGATALQFAASKGLLGIVYLLLEYGAEVDALAAEIDGRTALEGAAEHGRIDMVQLLLNAGAKICGDRHAQFERSVSRASEMDIMPSGDYWNHIIGNSG